MNIKNSLFIYQSDGSNSMSNRLDNLQNAASFKKERF